MVKNELRNMQSHGACVKATYTDNYEQVGARHSGYWVTKDYTIIN